ncbi:MAG: ATP-binding cassette domain-containing protein [Clostridia bacterium]|nr:ATP-binding cassette domain-containing protein [Clostridia bacterium]
MQTQENIIEVSGLTKRYRRSKGGKGFLGLFRRETEIIEGLTDCSFSVNRGEIVGLLGPNGAGKSTTVKLLTGILTADSGDCRVFGLTPWLERRKAAAHLGAVFGQRMQLWWDVPILDSFRLLRDIYAVPEGKWKRRLDELTDALELQNLLQTPIRQMSLGQRMRAELCGSLLHEPELLFLDEPTIGLDAVSKLRLRDFLKRENADRGTTILLTTHDMSDMLALCPRVLVLGRGRLLYDGALDALLRRYDTLHTLRCIFDRETTLSGLPASVRVQREDEAWTLTFAPAEIPVGEVLEKILSSGKVRELTLKEQDSDELVARMYGDMKLA